ncbi:MAG: hypothetical protein KKC46_11950 [Proteobacteria bacterium]|nr:hypothetical protein [Pseudomonadota bacterium]
MNKMDKIDKSVDRIRVTTLLSEEEKEALKEIAWKSGRSMSGYIRNLVIEAIEINS